MGWLGKLADGLLFDLVRSSRSPSVGRRVPGEAERLREAIRSLMAGASPRAVGRVATAIELARLGFGAEARGSRFDLVMEGLRPFLRVHRPPRTPSLSRLAWMPVEPLLVDGQDPRPWSIRRAWLQPCWSLILARRPDAAAELSAELAGLAAREGGAARGQFSIHPEPLGAVARAAQEMALSALEEATGDDSPIDSGLAAQFDGLPAPPAGQDRPEDRLRPVLERLAAALAARLKGDDAFLALRLGIDDIMARPGWRERIEILDDLRADYERTIRRLDPPAAQATRGEAARRGAAAPSLPPAALPSAALLVLLGRSAGAPWPLLEAMRMRAARAAGPDRRPLDTKAPHDVQVFVEDLVGEAERLGAAALAALSGMNAASPEAGATLAAAEACGAAAGWLHGIMGCGFLDPGGARHRRVIDLKERLAGRVEDLLLPSIRALVAAPLAAAWDRAQPGPDGRVPGWAEATVTAVAALIRLRALAEGPDGLRCAGVAAKVVREWVHVLAVAGDGLVAALRSGRAVRPERVEAVLRLSETADPALGSALRRRLGNAAPMEPGGVPGDTTA